MLIRNGLQKKNRLKIGKHFTGGWKLKVRVRHGYIYTGMWLVIKFKLKIIFNNKTPV